MTGIDWKRELRKIEREFDGLPPEPSPAELRARRAAERKEQQRKAERNAKLGAWARLLLVAALGSAMLVWPYPRACGAQLLKYLGADTAVIVGGLWVAACTWRLRMPRTHGLAMALTLWGLVLTADPVLQRVGYARLDGANSTQWWCR